MTVDKLGVRRVIHDIQAPARPVITGLHTDSGIIHTHHVRGGVRALRTHDAVGIALRALRQGGGKDHENHHVVLLLQSHNLVLQLGFLRAGEHSSLIRHLVREGRCLRCGDNKLRSQSRADSGAA